MLVSTARYSGKGTRELAAALAAATGSKYSARGKKTVETLVSLARKKGERRLALVFPEEIAFISVSASGWKWMRESLRVKKWKAGELREGEIGSAEGNDGPLFARLFAIDLDFGGEAVLCAENGKMSISEGEETLLEMDYKVVEDEKQRGDNA